MLEKLIQIAQEAGKITLYYFKRQDLRVNQKLDRSVFTEADMQSHQYICMAISKLYPNIPIISEEASEQSAYAVRKNWEYLFLVDPLDGSKEYVSGSEEFTVNIALIKNHEPILGVLHAPALQLTYYAERDAGAHRIFHNERLKLEPIITSLTKKSAIRVAISRSHLDANTQKFIKQLMREDTEILTIPGGSAIKFGLIAERTADIYPRFAPTMEWDTAAGQIIVNEIGKKVYALDDINHTNTKEQLLYNKIDLVNPGFIVY